ncbi:MAG: hypothetical protein HY741_09310 [Chloroflexi bacterium]|nr:hypothetical protein [Chloroflexota bacterium]
MSESESIEIRLCKAWDECVQCEQVQREVWNMPDFRDVVPASFLITAAKNGGLLVGAFQGARMVGFAFGVLGSEGTGETRRLKHTSHMLGVLPTARVKGLGAQLKWRQREEALKQGLDLMTWTYDPLQAVNAYLNIGRLGALARRYTRDAYGEMTDGEILCVEIPADLNALKAEDRALAAAWREHTRSTFERAFAAGYAATDAVRTRDAAGRLRVYYVLSKPD